MKCQVYAQLPKAAPEFSNEIYLFDKESGKLVRLEKGNARLETKAKMAGMGGVENGYELENEKSTVRLKNNKDLTFIFYSGGKKTDATSAIADSLMRSMGISIPAMPQPPGMQSGNEICTLYSMKCGKGKRSIVVQSEEGNGQAANGVIQSAPGLMQAGKGGLAVGVATVGIGVGMKLLGKGKKESIKYDINIKKLKEDFYEITISKNLPKGEYAFVMGAPGGMDNSTTLFSFSIE